MQTAYCTAKVRHIIGIHPDGKPQYTEWRTIADNVHNLLTNVGKDLLHNYGYIYIAADTITAIGANFIGLTEATITPDVADTVLDSEIAADGLERAAATTVTHTPGANTSTISNTFTASGPFTSVLASALFTEDAAGDMVHIANFDTGSGTMISGDQLAVTWTITLS
jgi:hypothetical protein